MSNRASRRAPRPRNVSHGSGWIIPVPPQRPHVSRPFSATRTVVGVPILPVLGVRIDD